MDVKVKRFQKSGGLAMGQAPKTNSEMTVVARDVHKSFGQLHVLRGVSLEVEKGKVAVIIGPSGSGKSTFLRCVNFLEEYEVGRIYVNGELVGYREDGAKLVRLPESALKHLRADVSMVFQRFNLFPHMTAVQNVMLGPLKTLKLGKVEATHRATEMLRKVGLADKLNEYPNRLSGGQQQRVAIARALAMSPKVILFDEVTSALDPELVEEVLLTIQQIAAASDMTMIIVTHEMQFAKDIADEVVFMDYGTVVERGTAKQIFESPTTDRLQTFLRRFHKER
jgi:polar amino acid transport system ATP-binding protein